MLDGNEETASGQVLRSAVFYDNKYRPVQTVSENYAGGGTTRISTRFSFDGLPEAVLETQIFGSATNTIAKRMEYDHARRLLKEYHKFNAQVEVLLTENVYDELGKLKSKKQNTVETVNYAYNIRDWLTSAKASKFSVDLTYNFNGNIATQIAAGTQYAYMYDAANRLTAGTHSGGFTENGITYDANGNIATLNRVGTSPGAFTYSYTGNKLTSLKVNTASYAYTYDANGNATKDGYRGMDLQYNLLNLPRKVSKGTGSVEYVYLASGAKLAKKVNGAFTQFYNGSVVYKGDKIAEYISTSEGLAMKTASGFAYQYNLSDHLGNVRVVLNQDKSVAQSTNYYPFGLAHATSALDKNKYLYNGKEIQNDVIGGTAFGMLDYGARFYDPVIGRWHSIDPLAGKYAGLSGYNYVANNPMKFIDPNGKDIWIHYRDENNNLQKYLFNPNEKYKGENHFVSAVYEAYNYLKENGVDMNPFDIFIGNDKVDINVHEADKKGEMGTPNKEYTLDSDKKQSAGDVYWNPNLGLKFPTYDKRDKEGAFPPSVGLLHEIGHVYRVTEIGGQATKKELGNPDRDWVFKGEKYVIKNIEHPASIKLGLKTRINYERGSNFKTTGVNSINPVIKVKRKNKMK